jgi:hypothetical protein
LSKYSLLKEKDGRLSKRRLVQEAAQEKLEQAGDRRLNLGVLKQLDSDIDLCVLTSITDRRPVDISIDLRRRLFSIKKIPLDILTYNEDLFAEHVARQTSFAHLINTEGVVVYER